jgi:RimJ/RimL family protein N-acetyltransferase
MLAEMPVAEVTLNELSRRVGLAKSNVLRYFESREAVLLELLNSADQDWLTQLDHDLMAADPAASIAARCAQLAATVAASLASRPMLCDLISAQAAVLERNVSLEVAARYKRASMADITVLGGLMLRCVPELSAQDAVKLAGVTIMTTGALWPHTQPSAALLGAYEADPELAAMRLDFTATIREVIEVMSAGLLARGASDRVLHTHRLVLQPVTAGDHAALLAHWTAPDVCRFLFDGEALSATEISEAIQDSAQDFDRAGYGLWLVYETDRADFVGTAGLRPLEGLGLEVFYSLAPGSWGKGYATEAARAVLDHALGPLGLPEVLAEVDAGNKASIAVIERLGMTPFDTVPGVLGPMIRYRKTR